MSDSTIPISSSAKGGFIYTTGKLKLYLNYAPKIYNLVKSEFGNDQPRYKSYFKEVEDRDIVPQRFAKRSVLPEFRF